MKYAVSSYSFSNLIKSGEMTQLDCIKKAKEMGFDAIEMVEIANFAQDDLMGYAKELAKEAQKQKIEISNLAVGADFINAFNGDTAKEIERVKTMVDAAEVMGSPCIRHDVIYSLEKCSSFDRALPIIADACLEITQYAQEKGIKTSIENHGFICQDSNRIERLFNSVNHLNFGVLVDIGNFTCVDENPVTAVSRVAPYAVYVHAKDFLIRNGEGKNPGRGFFKSRGGNYLRGTILGHGDVPVKQCLDILKNAGYDGYITLEYEGLEPTLLGIEIGFENLKNY